MLSASRVIQVRFRIHTSTSHFYISVTTLKSNGFVQTLIDFRKGAEMLWQCFFSSRYLLSKTIQSRLLLCIENNSIIYFPSRGYPQNITAAFVYNVVNFSLIYLFKLQRLYTYCFELRFHITRECKVTFQRGVCHT